MSLSPGEILVGRYLCKGTRIFLDTKPGLYPVVSAEMPAEAVAYLRLSPYQLHIPQVYEVLTASASLAKLLLLDQAAFSLPDFFRSSDDLEEIEVLPEPQLLPALTDVWQEGDCLRQLHYLWQIAQLWKPLEVQKVVSSLLAPELLRIEGSLVRLLELRQDRAESFNLGHLGQLWLNWVPTAKAEVAPHLTHICQDLIQGNLRHAEQIVQRLDELLFEVGRSPLRTVQLTTATDKGPSRQRNEDACFPPSGTVVSQLAASEPILLIVCDGIGGHQGGDVASHLAIEVVRQQVQSLPLESLDSPTLMTHLEQAVCVANDVISQRNDSENRMERQRMGTTLVMGLVRAHELYITHIGDSRAYRISQWSCRQVTQDDDVASREVRLGYSPYREALQQPSSGSLVQALGMGASSMLHPTVQRFILDEDSLFLLCSDGLSDNDRVEEIWGSTLRPLLIGQRELVSVRQELIDIANTRNGHDNVTVGLFTIQRNDPLPPPLATGRTEAIASGALAMPMSSVSNTSVTATTVQSITSPTVPGAGVKTKILPGSSIQKKTLPLLAGLMLLIGGAGGLLYSLSLSFRQWVDFLIGLTPNSPASVASASPDLAPTSLAPVPTLDIGSFAQVHWEAPPNSAQALPSSLLLLSRPEVSSLVPIGAVPNGSVIVVLQKQRTQQDSWVEVKICSSPLSSTSPSISQPLPGGQSPLPSTSPPLARAGQVGWISEGVLLSLVVPKITPNLHEQGTCIQAPPLPLHRTPASNVS